MTFSFSSTVSLVIGYGLDNCGSIPGGSMDNSLLHSAETYSGDQPTPCRICTGVKVTVTWNSLPFSGEVKNAWSYTSTIPL